MPGRLVTAEGREIAYDLTEGCGPGIVFLGGFKSDKEGTKALALEAWAKARGRAFLRFDYSGHGSSSGDFLAGFVRTIPPTRRHGVGALKSADGAGGEAPRDDAVA